MAWETRARGTRYYTRSRRVNGRVVREYIGIGLAAEIAARTDERERAYRQARAQAEREERERLDALDGQVDELCGTADVLARAALVLAGFHQHHRGEWRRRRGQAQAQTTGEHSRADNTEARSGP